MLSDEWLSRYGLLENFNASVTRTGTGTGTHMGTGTWTTGVTAIALCTSCSRAKKSRLLILKSAMQHAAISEKGNFSLSYYFDVIVRLSLMRKTIIIS